VPARISVFAVALLSIGIISGVGWWAMQPYYVPLLRDLEPATAGTAISVLEENGIAYKMNFSGTSIQVDQNKWDKANQLLANVVPSSSLDAQPLANSMLSDPATADRRMINLKEMELGETIKRLKPIESARVHLGIPNPVPFARDRKEKTASVTIQMRAGQVLSRKLANAIISTVANGVEGLDPTHVNLTDTDGNQFDFEQAANGGAGHLEYQTRLERELAHKAESMLDALLGPGRSVVRVTADIDFTKKVTSQKRFDPKSKVIESEKTITTKGTAEDPLAMGAAGAASNLGNAGGTLGTREVVSNSEERDVTYRNGEIIEESTAHPGQIKRLSIAVMVQLTEEEPAQAAAQPAAGAQPAAAGAPTPAPISIEDVESIVQKAVGYDPKRLDEIEVVSVPKLVNDNIDLTQLIQPPTVIETWLPLIRNISLGVAALVALFLGLLTLKRIKPIEINNAEPVQGMSPQRARQLSELAVLARKNPELLSSIMSAWMNSTNEVGGQDSSSQSTPQRKAG